MIFYNNNLPDILNMYLEEIYSDEELRDAFYDCDIEVYGPEWINDFIDDKEWREDIMPGESNYEVKPFARSGDGGLWVILNDEFVGYVGTEGECGIVARNVNEFMNIVAICKFLDFRISALKDEDSFMETLNASNKEFEHHEAFTKFVEKHEFKTNPGEVYKLLKLGLTVQPFFEVKATDDDYCDSYSLLGADDGQKALEGFIANYL